MEVAMFTIGCHLSVTKGFYRMAQTATELGANTFQFFHVSYTHLRAHET